MRPKLGLSELNDNTKVKRIGFIVVILLALIVCALLVFKPWVKEAPTKVEPTPIAETTVTPTPVPDKELVVEQENAQSKMKGKVINITDNTSSIVYTVEVGIGSAKQETYVTADMSTVIYGSTERVILSPENIKEGVDITFFAVGSIEADSLVASAIVLGNVSSELRFGRLSEIYQDDENTYVGSLSNSADKLKITSDTELENGFLQTSTDLELIKPNSAIFYYVKPEYTQTESGLIYDVTRIVVVSDGQ